MRHPDFGEIIEHGAGDQWLDLGMTILALRRRVNLSAERMGQGLHSITDPKDGQTCFEDEILNIGRALFIHRLGSTRKDESLGLDRKDLFHRRVPGEQLAIDLRLTHTPRNDLRILRTEIENGN